MDAAQLGQEFDPFHDPMLSDPYPFFERARRQAPIFYAPDIDHWVVTRREDIKAVFMDPETYSARNTIRPVFELAPEAQRILRDGQWRISPALGNNDPPDHGRFRSAVNRAFTARRVAQLQPVVRELVDEGLERFQQRGQAELMGELLYDLPATVILTMLGIPQADVPVIRKGSANRVAFVWGRPTPEQQVELAQGMVDFWSYLRGVIDERLENPGSDLVSDLIAVRDGDDGVLSLDEIASVLFAFLTAGHETTSSLLGNAVRTLLDPPRRWSELVASPDLIPAAVEEVLRFESPVTSWRREVAKPTELAGQTLQSGDQLLLLLGSANRDEAVFERPDDYDPHRSNARDHLSFGHGIHFCLGAPLARLEGRVVLERLTVRFPSLRLVGDQSVAYPPNTSFRGPLELQVTWETPSGRVRSRGEADAE